MVGYETAICIGNFTTTGPLEVKLTKKKSKFYVSVILEETTEKCGSNMTSLQKVSPIDGEIQT